MSECDEEQKTQHHRGPGNGFGPVQDEEIIYFAVFEQTPVDGGKLALDSFDSKSMKRDGQSVSRASFTTRAVFDQDVVKAGANPKGEIKGVSSALVQKVRSLQSPIKLNASEVSVRSFCVLDHVLPGDYDSHATICFGERTTSHGAVVLSQGQIKSIRQAARLELADAFGPIRPIDDVEFAEDNI
ncbi:hypothetical protein [Bradyrhizobium sp. BR13661]|jgi:hypothetical protein|uniref:hypothetical protein n=1 Tax=Bradyrhizobium sp. BR13661 TaxID=2940622 RepID=UPI0024749838|nr:hypothetical protein [Bradyrhizobium sp. BR13661]MDH6261556.1 hypothetical protein [Bradyrhizobium sp. BR13661]